MAKIKAKSAPATSAHELLTIAYWWHRGGAPNLTPDWVKRHPMWPDNNDSQDPRLPRTSRWAGKERLWEAIRKEYGLEGAFCDA